jgi:uncharacterized membrane protein YeaQ/YmgE (transglycosylase-associated protein family)
MNTLMWLLAGAFVGWVAFKYIGANEDRGMMISIIIGVVGGFIGGNIVAPTLDETVQMPDVISTFALVVAVASAALCLSVGDMVSKRFDI